MQLPLAIQEKITHANHIVLFGHDKPDGDALGSMLGLGKVLENMNKKVYYYAFPSVSRVYQFLPGIQKIKNDFDYKRKYDLLIFLDFSYYGRCAFTAGQYDYFDNKDIIVIDHHLGSTPDHALVHKDSDSDSNCGWIRDNIKKIYPDYIDREVATYLYMGIATDTGSFQYDRQSNNALRRASELVQAGADKQLISKHIFGTIRLPQLQFLGLMMPRFQLEKGLGFIWYSYEDFEQYGLDKEEAGGYLTGTVSKIEGQRFSIIMKIEQDCIKMSLRSQDPLLSAEKLAREFGGGGHFYAAGAKMMKEIGKSDDYYRNIVLEKAMEFVKNA